MKIPNQFKVLFIFILWVGTVLVAQPATAQDVCGSFRNCYNTGSQARDGGNIPLAIKAYSKACRIEVKQSLSALKYSACLQIINFSRATDDFKTAHTYFEKDCTEGSSNACLFLGKLEAEQGNIKRAMELAQPLCEEGFRYKNISGYDACEELKKYKRQWKREHPDPPSPPRPIPLAIAGFAGIIIFTLLSFVLFLWSFKKAKPKTSFRAMVFSLLGLASYYVYYESGVPGHAAIRLDLLILLPILITNIVVLISASVRLWTQKKLIG
jgi:hypothetical protein